MTRPPLVDLVLKYTKDSESPKKYYYWATLSAIAAVVKDNVYLDKFFYKLQPNIYVLLVGRSGLRKGPPVALAKAMVKSVNNTRVFAGRVSIQGVIMELAKAKTVAAGGPPITDGAGYLVASEFASFIIQDPAAMTILTDLYDGHYNPDWSYMLRNTPTDKIVRPCLTFIGATNEVHLRDAIPDNAIGGGFLARTFIVYSNKKSGINSLTTKPLDMFPVDVLYKQMEYIAATKGEFSWSADGKALYDAWYTQIQALDSEDDSTGTMERLHDHVLKVAMLVSLSRSSDLVLTHMDIEEAIQACQDFVPGAKRVALGQVGKSISAPGTAVLIRELITNEDHKISRTQALQKHWQHFDSHELDRIVESLEAQKAIKVSLEKDAEGTKDIFYVLNPKVLERFKEKQGE